MTTFFRSIEENWRGILLMSCSALAVSVGQLFWKQSQGSNLVSLLIGFALYGMGALLMVVAFKFGKLSVVHPVLSLSYVFGALFGYVFLGEVLRTTQVLAIALIMIGVAMVGGGSRE